MSTDTKIAITGTTGSGGAGGPAVQRGELQPKPPALNHSERFTQKVLAEFGSNVVGTIQVTDYQRQLIQGYFIAIDRALKVAEENRIRKNEGNKDQKYNVNLPVTWENVNMVNLALDVVHFARMGLDMMQANHLFPIPYRNKKTNKYDLTLMPGYNGIRYIAEKYAIEKPLAVAIELVHKNDTFTPLKKSRDNPVDSYVFEINSPFDRGEILGGFGYITYADPVKNKLVIMTMAAIEKRKPSHAATEFWGGKTKTWENGKPVETEAEGWLEEMCLKTLKREVYSAKHMPRDPRKVDAAYHHMKMREAQIAALEARSEIEMYANAIEVDTEPVDAPPPTADETNSDASSPETSEGSATQPLDGKQTDNPTGPSF